MQAWEAVLVWLFGCRCLQARRKKEKSTAEDDDTVHGMSTRTITRLVIRTGLSWRRRSRQKGYHGIEFVRGEAMASTHTPPLNRPSTPERPVNDLSQSV